MLIRMRFRFIKYFGFRNARKPFPVRQTDQFISFCEAYAQETGCHSVGQLDDSFLEFRECIQVADETVTLTQSMISQYLSKPDMMPRKKRLIAIADALNVNLDWLAGMDVDRKTGKEIKKKDPLELSIPDKEKIDTLITLMRRVGYDVKQKEGSNSYLIRYYKWQKDKWIEASSREMMAKFEVVAGVATYALTHEISQNIRP